MTTSSTQPSRTAASKLDTLMAMRLPEAFIRAHRTLDDLKIVPADCHVVRPVSTQLLAAAQAAGVEDVASLLRSQRQLLSDLTGLSNLDGDHEEAVASELHTFRNVLAAVLVAAGRGCGVRAEQVLTEVLRLTCTRSWLSRRSISPDEALLLRLVAEDRAGTDFGLRGACTYVLAEASAGVGELTAVYAADVAGDLHQRNVALPGSRRKTSSTVTLDAWGSRLLDKLVALRLRQHDEHGAPRPLTYLGKHAPGSAEAQQSATPILDKMRTLAGLNTADTTAGSIPLYRAEQARLAEASAADVITLLRTRPVWPNGDKKRDGGHEQACRELRVARTELGPVAQVVTKLPKRAGRREDVAA